jgi:hypothetical protein
MSRVPEIDAPPAPVPLRDGDRVLLATDGLFKTLSPAEMLAGLRETGDPAEALVRKALSAGLPQQDNITVLAICCGEGTCVKAGEAGMDDETAEMRKPEFEAGKPEPPATPPAKPTLRWVLLAVIALAVSWALLAYATR